MSPFDFTNVPLYFLFNPIIWILIYDLGSHISTLHQITHSALLGALIHIVSYCDVEILFDAYVYNQLLALTIIDILVGLENSLSIVAYKIQSKVRTYFVDNRQ